MSDILNGYATLTEFRNYLTPPKKTLDEDSSDDEVIKDFITIASRRVDDLIGRVFYPRIETQSYDIPYDNVIWFGDDLLAVTTFSNGDGTAIASSEYNLKPYNAYPKYALQMKDVTSTIFVTDSNSSSEGVLDILGYWGFHEQYLTRAWRSAGTLALAIASTTALTFTMTAGHTLEPRGGQIIKIDNELMQVSNVTGDVVTVAARGDNGSTAATHLITTPVYAWHTMSEIKALAIEICKIMYRSRYGENVDVVSTYTPAGVIVTPRSLPVWAQEIIRKYQRIV